MKHSIKMDRKVYELYHLHVIHWQQKTKTFHSWATCWQYHLEVKSEGIDNPFTDHNSQLLDFTYVMTITGDLRFLEVAR